MAKTAEKKGQFSPTELKKKYEQTMAKREGLLNKQNSKRDAAINGLKTASERYKKNSTIKNYRIMITAARRVLNNL